MINNFIFIIIVTITDRHLLNESVLSSNMGENYSCNNGFFMDLYGKYIGIGEKLCFMQESFLNEFY